MAWRPVLETGRIGALLLALGLAIAQGGWMHRIDGVVFDLGQRLQPVAAPRGVVIVAIDQHSLERIGRWPWPRGTDARLVEAVCAARPAAIGLDIAFTEPGIDPEGNSGLAHAIRQCGRVALPVVLENTHSGGQAIESLPIPDLSAAAAGLGRIGVRLDADGVARGVDLWSGVGAPVWPLLAQTLLQIAHLPVAGSAPRPAIAAVPAHPYALESSGSRLLRYVGPGGTVPRLSASALLDGRFPHDALRGQVVLIGVTAIGLGDFLATPVTAQGAPMPGVEVLANTLLGLRDGTLIRRLPLIWTLTGTALLALVPLLWLPRMMPLSGLLTSAVWVVVLLTGAAALPLLSGWWLPPGGALVAALSAYPLWSWRRLEAARRHLDWELRLLREAGRATPQGLPTHGGRRPSIEQRIIDVQGAQQRLRELQTRRDDALAFIGHDVRAPLAAAVEQLQSGPMDAPARARLLGQLQRAHDLAQGFLNLSRVQALEPAALAEIDLGAVLHQAADAVYDQAQMLGVRILRVLPDDPVWVHADFDALERAAVNLLRNAVQHSAVGSRVTLGAELKPRAVRFWVADQGQGLTPEQIDRLFQRYARGGAGSTAGGTGLGLYFVRLVAEKHGGEAGVESAPGAGARFWVELPRLD